MTDENAHPQFAKLSGDPAQLTARSLSSLSEQEWGPQAKRPWVHVADPHEALEKALWCYERGMVPVITEREPAPAVLIAQRYDADLLIADPDSLRALARHLPELPTVRTVCVLGARSEELAALLEGREARFIEA